MNKMWDQYDIYLALQLRYYDRYSFLIVGVDLYCLVGPVRLSFSYSPENMLLSTLNLETENIEDLIQKIVGTDEALGLLHPHPFVRNHWKEIVG
jgi:hypothetical protein